MSHSLLVSRADTSDHTDTVARNIEELEAPDFKGNDSTSKVKQRADEKERSREAHGDGVPHPLGMRAMQYTFAVNVPQSHSIQSKKTPVTLSAALLDDADHVMTSPNNETHELHTITDADPHHSPHSSRYSTTRLTYRNGLIYS